MEPGVGLGEPCGSYTAQDFLWFYSTNKKVVYFVKLDFSRAGKVGFHLSFCVLV